MNNPQLQTSESAADLPLFDMEPLADDLDDEEPLMSQRVGRKAAAEGIARRQLEELREAKQLQHLVSDYDWDEQDY